MSIFSVFVGTETDTSTSVANEASSPPSTRISAAPVSTPAEVTSADSASMFANEAPSPIVRACCTVSGRTWTRAVEE